MKSCKTLFILFTIVFGVLSVSNRQTKSQLSHLVEKHFEELQKQPHLHNELLSIKEKKLNAPDVDQSKNIHGHLLVKDGASLHDPEIKNGLAQVKSQMTMDMALKIAKKETIPKALLAVLHAESEGKNKATDVDQKVVDLAIAELLNAIAGTTNKIDTLLFHYCRPFLTRTKNLLYSTHAEELRVLGLLSEAEFGRLSANTERNSHLSSRDDISTEQEEAKLSCDNNLKNLKSRRDAQQKAVTVKQLIYNVTIETNKKQAMLLQTSQHMQTQEICYHHDKSRRVDKKELIRNGRLVFLDSSKTKGDAQEEDDDTKSSTPEEDEQSNEQAEGSEGKEENSEEDGEEEEKLVDDMADDSCMRCDANPAVDRFAVMEDRTSRMYGEEMDALNLILKEIADEEDRCNQEQQEFTDTINHLTTKIEESMDTISFYEAEKSSAQVELNEISRIKWHLNWIYYYVNNYCTTTVNHIATNEYCALVKIRDNVVVQYKQKDPIKDIVDCVLGQWKDGECSIKCVESVQYHYWWWGAHGQRTVTRDVITAPNEYGARCPTQREIMPCNNVPCPIDCQVGEWSAPSSCSTQCGEGFATQTRPVLVQAQYKGRQCDVTTNTITCNPKPCGNDCELEPWSKWGPCQSGCGWALQYSKKKVIREAKGEGYKECPAQFSHQRFRWRHCGPDVMRPCPTWWDVSRYKCDAKQSIFFGIDVSGSQSASGIALLKKFLPPVFKTLSGENMRLGMATFATKLTTLVNIKKANSADLIKAVEQITYSGKNGAASNGHLFIDECIRQQSYGGAESKSPSCVLFSDGKFSQDIAMQDAADKAKKQGIKLQIIFTDMSNYYRTYWWQRWWTARRYVSPVWWSNMAWIGRWSVLSYWGDWSKTYVVRKICMKVLDAGDKKEKKAEAATVASFWRH